MYVNDKKKKIVNDKKKKRKKKKGKMYLMLEQRRIDRLKNVCLYKISPGLLFFPKLGRKPIFETHKNKILKLPLRNLRLARQNIRKNPNYEFYLLRKNSLHKIATHKIRMQLTQI